MKTLFAILAILGVSLFGYIQLNDFSLEVKKIVSEVNSIKSDQLKLGASITTIQGTDTLTNSRPVINTNFSELNQRKLENASSTAALTITNLAFTNATSTGNLGLGTSTPSALFLLNVQGDSLFSGNLIFSGATATGTVDFSGATTLKVPVSASSTITASGELEIDTTDDAIHFNSKGTTYSLLATTTLGFTIASSTDPANVMDIALGIIAPHAMTITRVDAMAQLSEAYTNATTSGFNFNLRHGTNLGNRATLFTADPNTTTKTRGTSTPSQFTTGFNDNSIAKDEIFWLTTSAATSSLPNLVIQIYGVFNP